jgi:LPS-assembly protein
MHSRRSSFLTILALALTAPLALAQQPPVAIDGTTVSDKRELINNKDLHLVGGVELDFKDTKIYAEEVWIYTDDHRAVATGNVVFTQGENRIAADRAEFDTRTRLGVFHNATGIAKLQPQSSAGTSTPVATPPIAGQETDVYFFGDTVERIGAKKYRITNGGFTTCVQPTPRWILNAGTVILNIDHYTMLQQVLFRVKGVPLLYLPVLYYPTKEEGRATGFLLPSYGATTSRGQTIHNAFFWAINRSHDATIMHDWFSKTGQGVGTEYRYNVGGGSEGRIRTYLLNERQTTYPRSDGSTRTVPATRSHEFRGSASQRLPGDLRARGRVDYFSSLTSMQTFNSNINDTSRSQRSVGGNVVGSWGTYSLNATADYSEYFYSATSSTINGNVPKVTLTRSEQPLFSGAPVYLSVSSEYANLVRESRTATVINDSSTNRLDVSSKIRYPFKRWQWFTVNSSLAWRDTFYTRSLHPTAIDPLTSQRLIVGDNLNRQYVTVQAEAVGPTFNRIWDTPGSDYAERVKHTIEPFLRVERTSPIEESARIIRSDGSDYVVGGATRYAYGLNNRIYAKRKIGESSRAQEILSVALKQSYYTNERLAQNDREYGSSTTGAPPSRFSPVSLSVRATPSESWNSTLRAEVDARHRELRTLSIAGHYNWAGRVQTTAQWTQRFFIQGLSGYNNPNRIDRNLNVSTNVQMPDRRLGGAYSFNYDARRSRMLQQRLSVFYNTQCCGVAVEHQTFNFSGVSSAGVPRDRRFFVSFTLAGLGNFSPFSGTMDNVPR